MSNQVATKAAETELVPAQNEGGALISMIERVAMNPDTGIDTLERLLQMQERVLEREARAAYSRDFAAMQANIPTIKERGKGHGSITYALWEDVNTAIRPVLTKYGFGLSFKTIQSEKQITITAILSHREGHSEETTQSFPHDTSGGKNAIQAVGSSMTYGKRYTAGALLNLTSGETDTDGATVVDAITEDQIMLLRDMIEASTIDEPFFIRYANSQINHATIEKLADIPANNFNGCVTALKKKAA